MALESKKENNVVTELVRSVQLPRMARVRQLMDHSHIPTEEIAGHVRRELEQSGMRERIQPGASVAITCGSRGVANIAAVIKAIAGFVKECGGNPFVFPAMGSHGGATAEGQQEILTGYGVTEEAVGCPIRSSMEVVQIGVSPEGMPVYCDRYAYEADAIILCNRVKPHTAIRADYESGILKMSVIGLGKQKGAETVHANGFSDLGRMLPILAKVVFDHTNIIGAVALVENAFDQTCAVKGMLKEEIWKEEPKLLKTARARMGKIDFDKIDVLVVDRIGKDIGGDGMDPNIVGRFAVPHMKGTIQIQHIAVLDLTEETHGNCCGIGLADVTTKRLVDKVDVDCTYPNMVSNTVLCTPKIPLFTHSDRTCIQVALKTCNYIDREHPRIVRILDTMHLEEIEISEAMLQEAEAKATIEILGGPEEWKFDDEGNLF